MRMPFLLFLEFTFFETHKAYKLNALDFKYNEMKH